MPICRKSNKLSNDSSHFVSDKVRLVQLISIKDFLVDFIVLYVANDSDQIHVLRLHDSKKNVAHLIF